MARKKTEPLSPLVRPGHARLTVLAGDCPPGLTFSLSANSHEAGREAEHVTLAEDSTVSPHHATFTYRGETLQVTDRESLNGVYVRIRGPRELHDGDWFRVGGQYFRFHVLDERDEYPTDDGTLHFVSPKRKGSFRVQQVLDGGKAGLSSVASHDELTIGGEGSSVAFTADPHLSNSHAKVYRNGNGGFSLEDLGSTNGTYVRIAEQAALAHGDLLYLGNTLLRVDIT